MAVFRLLWLGLAWLFLCLTSVFVHKKSIYQFCRRAAWILIPTKRTSELNSQSTNQQVIENVKRSMLNEHNWLNMQWISKNRKLMNFLFDALQGTFNIIGTQNHGIILVLVVKFNKNQFSLLVLVIQCSLSNRQTIQTKRVSACICSRLRDY